MKGISLEAVKKFIEKRIKKQCRIVEVDNYTKHIIDNENNILVICFADDVNDDWRYNIDGIKNGVLVIENKSKFIDVEIDELIEIENSLNN